MGQVKEIIEKCERYIMNTYRRLPVVFAEGKGAKLFDIEGREYIDFVAGIAVNNLGYGHPKVVEAIKRQCERLIHISNLFYIKEQIDFAELLIENSPLDKVFFANSGAEAIEASIKLAKKITGRDVFISAYNSFHGRTFGALSLTGQEKYRKKFEPLMNRVKYVKYGNEEEIKEAINKKVAAVVLEPVQGEGGVIVPPEGYLKAVRDICDEKGVLLIFDEVQTGFGRTGKLFACQRFSVTPDIMAFAKAAGGGLPIGGIMAREGLEFDVGEHASTFGGNPLVCAAARASLLTILEENLPQRAENVGKWFMKELRRLSSVYEIREMRGVGLMIGVEFEKEIARKVVLNSLKKGLVLNNTYENVIRIVPPLIIEKEDLKKGVDIICEVGEDD